MSIYATKLFLEFAFGVCTGKRYMLKDVVALFEKILGKKINVNIGERPYKDREVMFPIASYSQLPNWKVRVSLEEGLAKFGK